MGCGLSKTHESVIATTKTLGSTASSSSSLGTEESLLPEVAALQTLIETNPILGTLFQQMFSMIPNYEPYLTDPSGAPQVSSYTELMLTLNRIIQSAPPFIAPPDASANIGFHPGTPIRFTLTWLMGTEAGKQAFSTPEVNTALRDILRAWSKYLESSASTSVLSDAPEGWFGSAAMEAMPDFDETYDCDPSENAKGFTSWDKFFTRKFRPGLRPIDFADRSDIINAPCEATPFRIQTKVKQSDRFWFKEQPYSLKDMLNDDTAASTFDGGTVYQANLNAVSYHRWHSPVNGVVKSTVIVPGTYYAQCPSVGFDPTAPYASAGYVAHVATRAIIFIEADNPNIGYFAFIAIGICEMSSVEITAEIGQKVYKGDEIGMFHFGGSSYALVFRPEANVTFLNESPNESLVLVNSAFGTVT